MSARRNLVIREYRGHESTRSSFAKSMPTDSHHFPLAAAVKRTRQLSAGLRSEGSDPLVGIGQGHGKRIDRERLLPAIFEPN